jgi:hypothetical protein
MRLLFSIVLLFSFIISKGQSLLISNQTTKVNTVNIYEYGLKHSVVGYPALISNNNSIIHFGANASPVNLAVNSGPAALKMTIDNNEHVNYTAFGSNAPFIKTKLLTGVLPAFDGSSISSSVVHGIGDYTKILAVNIEVSVPPLGLNPARTYPEEYTFEPGYQVSYFINGGGIIVINSNGNSFNVRNMPFKVYITYEQ